MEITPISDDLYQLDLSELTQICSSDEKYARICNDEKFIRKYEQKHFTVTRGLLERFSEKPAEFIDWTYNYCSWFLLTRDLKMNPCFMTIERSPNTVLNNSGDGLIGCIVNGIDIIKRTLITNEGDKLPPIRFENSIPTHEEILQILAPGLVLYMNDKIYEFPRCTLLYGLQDFIVYNQLTEDPHFALMFGMFYHLRYTLQIMETVYFGDINALSYGFGYIEKDDSQEQPYHYYPNNFDEFKIMFDQYFNYVSIDKIEKEIIIYLYEINHEDIALTGYLMTGRNQSITDVFGTEFFREFIENNKDNIDLTYDLMINQLPDISDYKSMINWLAYYRQNYMDSYIDIVNSYIGKVLQEPNSKYNKKEIYTIEGPTLTSELELLLLETEEDSNEYIFIQLCIIMISLCGWNILIRSGGVTVLE